MIPNPDEQAILDKLIRWGEAQEPVRLMLLTSTRANPGLPKDALSDYDVELAVTDMAPYVGRTDWLNDFGTPLIFIHPLDYPEEQIWTEDGLSSAITMVIFEDGPKFDIIVYPVALFDRYKAAPSLPETLDIGYRVLLDKDGLAEGLAPYTATAHIPPKPSEREYQNLVRAFWWDTTYVAKYLWRDELLFARYMLDTEIRNNYLRRVLEWSLELDHGWNLHPGLHGKWLKQRLPPDQWGQLAATFVGPDIADNWDALFRAAELFRTVAIQVGDALGYAYPHALDARVSAYLRGIRGAGSGR
ncbi:MAG: aminoglycoside 6-adenylyltransferase [Caldilineaceae bacterium]|nr:aminoglycoside 6-adenylyltransferase [Caldilineaceae bacterium]